jgi:hypothetical protein
VNAQRVSAGNPAATAVLRASRFQARLCCVPGACHIAVSGSIDSVAAHAMTVRVEDALADELTIVAAAARKAGPAFRQALSNQLAKVSRLFGDEVPQ